MKVLVTGGAGFIGTHLCIRLLEQGDDVICVDNLSTAYLNNFRLLKKYRNIQFVIKDVSQSETFGLLSRYRYIDQIYHLACPASPDFYLRNPETTIETTVIGTIMITSLAKIWHCPLLITSTSEVYGDPKEYPQSESYWGNVNPVGERACYKESKRCAETYAKSFCNGRGIPLRIARLFNVYGPGMNPLDGRIISNFIWQAIHQQPITVYGDGSQTRSFCYIDDMINGLIALMDNGSDMELINLGNPDEIEIKKVASIIKALTASSSPIVNRPLPSDDSTRRCPDITLAKNLLEWEPKIYFQLGLTETIRYFKELKRNESDLEDQNSSIERSSTVD